MKNIRKCIIGLFEYLRQNGIVLLLLALLAVILFGGMTGIMYSTDDEVSCYYRLHSGLSGNVLSVAKAQGRFYFLLSQFMAAVPFLIKNVVWYKLWAYGAVLFNMLLVWYLIRKYIGELPAYLTILCFLGLYELNTQHNLLVAYPFFLQQPLTGVLLSTEFFLRYQCEKKEIFAAASALAFLYACMFNESFISFGIIIAVIALRGCNSGWKGIRQWCRSIKYHIAAGVLYFAVYVLFRRLFHSTYGGNVIGESYTILQRFQTMLALMTGQSPLKSYRHLLIAGNKLNVSVLSVLKGGAAAFCCVHLLTRLYKHSGRTDDESINKEMYAYGTAVTLLVLFSLLLTLPYSLTDRYSKQILTGHIYSYVVSYYSFWFMAAAFCILLYMYFRKTFPFRRLLLVVLPVLAGFAGCLTEINNEYYENKLTDRAKDIQCYLGFIEGPVFGKLNRDDIVYVYGYNGVNNIIRNDQEYLRAVFHDEAPHLVTDIQELDLSGKEYCLYRNDKDNAVYFGKIDPDMRTSRVLVVSQDELTEKSLWIGRTLPQSGDIFVNNEWKGIYSGDAVVPLCIQGRMAVVEARNTDISSLDLVDGIMSNRIIDFQPGDGFYSEESGNDNVKWNWMEKNSILHFYNNSDHTYHVKWTAHVSNGSKNDSVLYIDTGAESLSFRMDQGRTDVSVEFDLPPGAIKWKLTTDGERVNAPKDPRELYVMVKDPALTLFPE